MHDHVGEHGGLGISGLRRIRQQPSGVPKSAAPSAAPSRSGSLSLQTPVDVSHPPLGTTMASPSLAFAEDLSRFPTESLHSFSFATQSDESMSNRQSILKRSIEFMRDRKGWAASNPGLVAAQARLNGDTATQSMLELLARSNLIGGDAGQGSGLGLTGPLTGPAELSGQNVFEQSFDMPRSSSPEFMNRADTPTDSITISKRNIQTQVQFYERLSSPPPEAEATRRREEKSPEAGLSLAPFNPRAALKRTFTSTDDLKVQTKLTDVLAQPYTIDEEPSRSYAPAAQQTSAPYVAVPSFSASEAHNISHASAPHGHNRYTPAAQAVFTTEAQSPWTITSANDLACLVFGVTRSEVRKLGILEVVREERRKWLEEKLRDPDSGTSKDDTAISKPQQSSPNQTSTLNMRSGITAKLLSKPSSREVKANQRSQTEDGSGSSYAARSKVKGGLNHTAHKSRGVILCGDVVPIQKRNGALGSASLWVKEKKGGLIWVLEEIAEDVATVEVDATGCITRVNGDSEAIWGTERVRAGMDIQRLIPAIPRLKGTNTGALDFDEIRELRSFTARTSNSIDIPVMVQQLIDSSTFRVSSFPHIAGIMVISSDTLNIRSSNSVFSEALFGYAKPEGMHINEIVPGFDRLLSLMTDEDHITLFEGIVIPEHSFRRARALLAMREGRANAAAAFFKPSGMPARHRDGAEVMVDIQMRVARSERHPAQESAILENEDPDMHEAEVVYALWITYSRQLHAVSHGVGVVSPMLSRPGTPPHQPSPGQTDLPLQPFEAPEDMNGLASPRAEENGEKTLGIVLNTKEDEEKKFTHKKTINDFVVLEDMGQGAYGQVKLCRSKLPPQNKVVIKYVTKRRILVDTWTRDRKLGTVPLEIHVLDYLRRDGLKHPNIVEMSDFFEDDVNYYIEMVPHGLPGMDLFDYIELRVNMDEEECRKIFVQVVEAVWHLHIKAKVVHRDIKDENVILDGEGNIKLIDFGSAAYIKSGPFDVFVGTIGK